VSRPLLLVLPLLAAALAACGGGSEPAAEPPPPSATEQTSPTTTEEETTTEEGPTTTEPSAPQPRPLPGLPGYTAGFEEWLRLSAGSIPPRESGDAHLGTKRVWTTERRDGARYPDGTIILKSALRPGKDFIGLVAIMRKRAGFDPEHNDWQFVEYTRESADARFELTARGTVCWSCHVGAAETDYVWIETLGLARGR
jgi:ABC-type transport system substrate-binding protein